MKENKKVPEIRFPEFTDDWEQRKFSDVFTGLQNNTLSRSELNYESGTVKNVHYGDVLIKFGDYIDASKEELPFINDDSKVEKFKGSFLHNGDIVIADTAEDETVGKCTEIQGVDDIKLISGLHTIPCRPKEEYGAKFLGYYMNSSAYHAQLVPLMQGIKVTSISKSALQDTNMIIPKSVDEQTIIGEYFSNLDNLITLHQRKCDKIKELKSCMLQKMFPKKGEKAPEIRFPEFTDDWEQRKVSEITTSYSGGTPKAGKAEYYDGDIPFIRSGEIYDKYTELFITQEGMNNSSAKMVSKGDILYALYGATSGEVSRAGLDGAINQAILAILPEEDIDADFLVEWFRNEKANIIDKYLQGGQGNLSAQIIKNLDILIPSFEEQQRMGQYFSELNNLITLHQRKCDALKELKKGMLQKMFV